MRALDFVILVLFIPATSFGGDGLKSANADPDTNLEPGRVIVTEYDNGDFVGYDYCPPAPKGVPCKLTQLGKHRKYSVRAIRNAIYDSDKLHVLLHAGSYVLDGRAMVVLGQLMHLSGKTPEASAFMVGDLTESHVYTGMSAQLDPFKEKIANLLKEIDNGYLGMQVLPNHPAYSDTVNKQVIENPATVAAGSTQVTGTGESSTVSTATP